MVTGIVQCSLRSWRDFLRECFCFGSEAVRGSVKSQVEFLPAQIFVGFFELCVHQCTRILDWLRALKRQSKVNLLYTSHLSLGKRFVFKHRFANGERDQRNAKRELYLQGKQKNYTKGRMGERFRGMMCKMGLTSLHDFYSL